MVQATIQMTLKTTSIPPCTLGSTAGLAHLHVTERAGAGGGGSPGKGRGPGRPAEEVSGSAPQCIGGKQLSRGYSRLAWATTALTNGTRLAVLQAVVHGARLRPPPRRMLLPGVPLANHCRTTVTQHTLTWNKRSKISKRNR